jgi:hypothetical protein
MSPTGVVPVPQDAFNHALRHLIKDADDIESLSVAIADGYFDVLAHVTPTVVGMSVNADVTLRISIERAAISVDVQEITLRRHGPLAIRGHELTDRIVATIIEAMVVRIFRIDPVGFAVERLPNVQREGDLFHVDAAPMLPDDVASRIQSPLFRWAHVTEILCQDERFGLRLAMRNPFEMNEGVERTLEDH